jgi:hypothetical protein
MSLVGFVMVEEELRSSGSAVAQEGLDGKFVWENGGCWWSEPFACLDLGQKKTSALS